MGEAGAALLGGEAAGEGLGDLAGVDGELLGLEGGRDEPEPRDSAQDSVPSSCLVSLAPATHSISRFLKRSNTTLAFK